MGEKNNQQLASKSVQHILKNLGASFEQELELIQGVSVYFRYKFVSLFTHTPAGGRDGRGRLYL